MKQDAIKFTDQYLTNDATRACLTIQLSSATHAETPSETPKPGESHQLSQREPMRIADNGFARFRRGMPLFPDLSGLRKDIDLSGRGEESSGCHRKLTDHSKHASGGRESGSDCDATAQVTTIVQDNGPRNGRCAQAPLALMLGLVAGLALTSMFSRRAKS